MEKPSPRPILLTITKCDEIFDLLIADGQIVVPQGLKNPPLEQKKKRGFCKFHNFLGHKTSQCVLFRDLVQKALKDGRLRFGEKPKMKVDIDDLKVEEALYLKPLDFMMVEATEGLDKEVIMVGDIEVMMVGTNDSFSLKMEEGLEAVYPQPKESLVTFKRNA